MLTLGPDHCRPHTPTARGRRSLQTSFEQEHIVSQIIDVWAVPGCYSHREHRGRRYVAALWKTNRRPMETIETLRAGSSRNAIAGATAHPASLTAFRLLGE